jgi:hypothetical protein
MSSGVLVGVTPDGREMFASEELIAQFGTDKVRYELVDREYLRRNMTPPGYHKIRIKLFSGDYVLVKADSFEEALKKVFKPTDKEVK